MLGRDYEAQDCALARSLEVIGERWTLLIVRDAFHGVRRFSDFQAHLDIPRAVLAERLGSLVENGILEKRVDPAHAGRSTYRLTQAGRDLWPVVHSLVTWGDRHREANGREYLHARCGTRLDEHGRCPACDVIPGPEDVVTSPVRESRAGRTDDVAVALRQPVRLLRPLLD